MEQFDLPLLSELEDKTLHMEYPLKYIQGIKKTIKSIELPMFELTIDTIKEISNVIVEVSTEKYVIF